MKVSVYAAYTHVKALDMRGNTVIIIDVLRATTTIVQALKNGCRQVVPLETPEEAVNIKKSNEDENTILGGERKGLKISGFDFGNSPLEYTPQQMRAKSLILCTTNGTRAILAARQAPHILIGALVNCSAVVEKAISYGEDISIICAGTKERFSVDDILAAGAMVARLEELVPEIELDDLAIISRNCYKDGKGDLRRPLEGTMHYEYLRSLGFEEDIDFCLQEDTADIVPEFAEGLITVLK